MNLARLTEIAKKAAREVGFDLAGISPVRDFPELEYFSEWLDAGYGGEMDYLAKRNDESQLKRASLRNTAPWAKSVIVCAVNYNSEQPYSTEVNDSARGWISRYAWTQSDYHDVVLEKLRRVEAELALRSRDEGLAFRSWCYVDTGPVVERVYARYAGIGWIGKNACIINQQLGSWLFLGVILTSLELTPDLPAEDRCGTCTRCLDACPTNAFLAPGKLDATRCISYLTIEKRGHIPQELREGIGRNIYGCDICQDVCPWNRKAPIGTEPALSPRPELVNPMLDRLAGLSLQEFREVFRGSPIKRTKIQGLLRNVLIAMGNSGNLEFAERLQQLSQNEDAVIAEHARWALERLQRLADGSPQENAHVAEEERSGR